MQSQLGDLIVHVVQLHVGQQEHKRLQEQLLRNPLTEVLRVQPCPIASRVVRHPVHQLTVLCPTGLLTVHAAHPHVGLPEQRQEHAPLPLHLPTEERHAPH